MGRQEEVSRVTISAGVATLGRDGADVEDLLDQADARLFEAKQQGRNRVVGPPEEPRNVDSLDMSRSDPSSRHAVGLFLGLPLCSSA